MTLKLIIGNKNYSSWSFRPWIGLKASGIAFDEEVIPLYVEGSKEKILTHSPAGKVPVLIDGATHVWESLAILEYAAEKFPAAQLWPSDPVARAHGRTISTEMHAGFAALRNECGMAMWRPHLRKELSDDAKANITRIQAIVGRHACAVRRRGAVPVRAVLRGGCDVRAGRLALRDVRDRCQRARQSLHAGDDRFAGVAGVAPRRAERELGAAAFRGFPAIAAAAGVSRTKKPDASRAFRYAGGAITCRAARP